MQNSMVHDINITGIMISFSHAMETKGQEDSQGAMMDKD